MGHIARGLGHLPAADVEPEHIAAYIQQRRRDGAAESTLRIELGMLRRGFRLAVKQRRLDASLMPDIPGIDRSRLKVRTGVLTLEQLESICRYLDQDLADLVTFLLASAWRVGEARALLWEWVVPEQEWVMLPASAVKNKRPRILPLAGEVAEIIERRRAREVGDYVFHRQGRPILSFGQAWETACRKAGLPGRLVHDLRRSAITRMMNAGANQADCMAISGHLTANVFQRYQIVSPQRQRDILERVAGKRPERMDQDRQPKRRLGQWG